MNEERLYILLDLEKRGLLRAEEMTELVSYEESHGSAVDNTRVIIQQTSDMVFVSANDKDLNWTDIRKRMAEDTQGDSIKHKSKRRRLWIAIAASILLLATAFILVRPDSPGYSTKKAVLHDELDDGSYFVLNEQSQLIPEDEFNSASRALDLLGEVYIEAQSSDIPMIVSTNQLEIHVLGTRFSIMDYPDDQIATVTLYEGSVDLRLPDGRRRLLDAGDHICWDKNNESVIPSRIKSKKPSWISGTLQFEGTRFTEVFTRLERVFDIEISGTEMLAGMHFNGQSDGTNITSIFDEIGKATGTRFQKTGERQYQIIKND